VQHLSECEFQARVLLAYVKRGGSAKEWWRSKDFSPDDRFGIKLAYAKLWGITISPDNYFRRDETRGRREKDRRP
jgi:hypothetical protein